MKNKKLKEVRKDIKEGFTLLVLSIFIAFALIISCPLIPIIWLFNDKDMFQTIKEVTWFMVLLFMLPVGMMIDDEYA